MKRADKPLDRQMNLSLLSMPAATVPNDKQRELTQALMGRPFIMCETSRQ